DGGPPGGAAGAGREPGARRRVGLYARAPADSSPAGAVGAAPDGGCDASWGGSGGHMYRGADPGWDASHSWERATRWWPGVPPARMEALRGKYDRRRAPGLVHRPSRTPPLRRSRSSPAAYRGPGPRHRRSGGAPGPGCVSCPDRPAASGPQEALRRAAPWAPEGPLVQQPAGDVGVCG
ncbi:hypothetical protein LTR60_002898, partial [Cryomyces antarcticus]